MVIGGFKLCLVVIVGEDSLNDSAVFQEEGPVAREIHLEVISRFEVGVHVDFEDVGEGVVSELVGDGDGGVHDLVSNCNWSGGGLADFLKDNPAVGLEDHDLYILNGHFIGGVGDSADEDSLVSNQWSLDVQAIVDIECR